MREGPAWFDRKFELSYPVQLLPSLCARLRGTAARLEELVRRRSHASLTAKSCGKWSAQENAGHLVDLERLWLARVGDYAAGSNRLSPADLTNRRTTDAGHDLRPVEEILRDFRAERELLMKHVDGLDASLFLSAIPHPRLQTPMRLADHLSFVAEHDDHHLARIWTLVTTKEQACA